MSPFWHKRDRRLSPREPFPPDWIATLRRNMPLYGRLPAQDRDELHHLIRKFLAGKDFEGCGGMEVTDEVRLTIAAQACLLLLHRQAECFPSVSTVLVYPSAFVVDEARRGQDGVVSAGPSELVGEAWQRGPVILAWDDVLASAADERDGHNVVLHEFAHKLDEEDGAMDGAPSLGPSARYAEWARILAGEYRLLRRDSALGRRTVLDGYGAENPVEFFAVATECFFEEPVLLKQRHPRLYQELAEFYRQDPAQLFEGNGGPGTPDSE
jgi:Mlc titration factor MtfA (ptsG expression regulator)